MFAGPLSILFIAINVGAFAIMVQSGVPAMDPDASQLRAWGGTYAYAVRSGEWWRLLTCGFIHSGAVHLAVNCYALFQIGGAVERLFGKSHYAALYLLTLLISSVSATLWNPIVVTVGASGAVFGVFGAIISFLLVRRHELDPRLTRPFLAQAVVIIAINLAYGLSVPGISNAGHLSGLLSGLLLGAVMARPLSDPMARERFFRPRLLTGISIGAAAIAAGVVLVVLTAPRYDLLALIDRIDATEGRFGDDWNDMIERRRAGAIDDAATADEVEGRYLPIARAIEKDLDQATRLVPRRLRDRLAEEQERASLRRQALEHYVIGLRSADKESLARFRELWEKSVQPPP